MNLHAERNGGRTRSLLPQRRTASSSQSHRCEAHARRLIQCWTLRPACSESLTIRSVASLPINRQTGIREVASLLRGNHPPTATRRIGSGSTADPRGQKQDPHVSMGCVLATMKRSPTLAHPGRITTRVSARIHVLLRFWSHIL
jgi:hypothetical protein